MPVAHLVQPTIVNRSDIFNHDYDIVSGTLLNLLCKSMYVITLR